MPRGEYLGEIEQMVMLAVARLGDGAYGMAILDEIHARTGADAGKSGVFTGAHATNPVNGEQVPIWIELALTPLDSRFWSALAGW